VIDHGTAVAGFLARASPVRRLSPMTRDHQVQGYRLSFSLLDGFVLGLGFWAAAGLLLPLYRLLT